MKRALALLIFAIATCCQAQTIATLTIGATPGNTVPQYAVGFSNPFTDYPWMVRSQNCGNFGQPICTVNTPLVTLMGSWNQHNRMVYYRLEADPFPPYLYECNNKPIAAAITGNATSGVTWSTDGAGNATLNLPSAMIFTTTGAAPSPANGTFAPQTSGAYASVYIDGFGSSAAALAGLDNTSTPANVTTPYTITGSTSTSISITGLPVTGVAQSGTEDGFLVPAPQYYPAFPAPTCTAGSFIPPAQAAIDTGASMAGALPNYVFSVGNDLYNLQIVNGHYFGPLQGDGTNAGNTLPFPRSYAAQTVPMWKAAFATASTLAGRTIVPYRIEIGNEPDNYPSGGLPNFALPRNSSYNYFPVGMTAAAISILQPGSGQTNGTYVVTGTDGAAINLTIAGGVCTAVSVNAAGTVTWGASPPVFTISEGGTPCQIMTQAEGWSTDYADTVNELKNDGISIVAPALDPATAGNAYHGGLVGSTAITIGSPPTVPSLVYFATPGTGLMPLGDEGQHSYPYGKAPVCPNYALSSISRVNPGTFTTTGTWSSSPTNDTITVLSAAGIAYGQGIAGTNIPAGTLVMNVSGTTLTLSQYTTGSGSGTALTFTPLATTTITTTLATNFQTSVAAGAAPVFVTADALTFTVADADTVNSYSFTNGIAGINSVGTINVASTPTLSVGNYINLNGACFDSVSAGASLFITAIVGNSYLVSGGPFFSDSGAATCSSNGFDQLTIHSGAIATTAGITGNTSLNLVGGRIAATVPATHPYVVTFTNTTGAFSSGAATGGTLVMTAQETQNITNTPAQTDGWNLDLQPGPGCPNIASSNQYVYPQSNYPGNSSPYCGTSAGYFSANFNQRGTASTITFTNPTTATFAQQGPTDSATSGLLTLVTSTVASPYTAPNAGKNPICNPPDLLLAPLSADIAMLLNSAHRVEAGFLEVGTNTGYGGLAAPLPFRISETNSMSPAQVGITNTFEQALWWLRHAATNLTFNGYNGTLGATGHTGTGSTYPMSGFDGENPFTGQSTAYGPWTMKFSPPTVGGVATNYLQDVTSQTAAPVMAFYYGNLALADWLGTGCTGAGTPTGCNAATTFLNVTGINPCGSNIPGVCGWALLDGTTGHTRVLLVNESEAASGNIVINGAAGSLTTGTESILTVNPATPPLTIQATLTGYSLGVASFTVPCGAVGGFTGTAYNVNYNQPLVLSGFASPNTGLNGQTVYVATHILPAGTPASPTCTGASTEPFTATVTGSGYTTGIGTASDFCPTATTTPSQCTWGISYRGQTADATFNGALIGALSTPTITAASHVFTLAVPAMTAMVLDLSNGTTTASAPSFSPVAGTYAGAQSVTSSTTSPSSFICWNTTGVTPATNGNTGSPACTSSTLYTGAITVSSSETIYAVTGGTGYADSTVSSAAYVINGAASMPTFSPVAGTYAGTQVVTASTSTSGCGSSIFFDTNPTPVTNQTTLSVSASETVYAYVHSCPGFTDSPINSAVYTITGAAGANVVSSGGVVSSGSVKSN